MLVRGSCSAYGTFAAARLQPWSLVRLFSPVAAERFERRFGCEHVSRADLPEARLIERGIGVLLCCFDSFSARRAVAEQHDNVRIFKPCRIGRKVTIPAKQLIKFAAGDWPQLRTGYPLPSAGRGQHQIQ
jgi:hypothetical protein